MDRLLSQTMTAREMRSRFSQCSCGLRALRVQRNFLKQFNLIWVVQSPSQKYFDSLLTQIASISFASRPTQRGVSRSSRTLGRDAMDVRCAADESAFLRTVKSCGPDASMVGVKSAE
jgi:hypothetical protein